LPAKYPVPGKGAERQKLLAERFADWLRRERGRTVTWTPLRPVDAKANLPLLTVEADGAVFVSGDITKPDVPELRLRTDLRWITAIRLDALADDRLPRQGTGRVYYGFAGNNGDFFLSDFALEVGGAKVPFAKASHSFAAGSSPAKSAIDGDPQSGWSVN